MYTKAPPSWWWLSSMSLFLGRATICFLPWDTGDADVEQKHHDKAVGKLQEPQIAWSKSVQSNFDFLNQRASVPWSCFKYLSTHRQGHAGNTAWTRGTGNSTATQAKTLRLLYPQWRQEDPWAYFLHGEHGRGGVRHLKTCLRVHFHIEIWLAEVSREMVSLVDTNKNPHQNWASNIQATTAQLPDKQLVKVGDVRSIKPTPYGRRF